MSDQPNDDAPSPEQVEGIFDEIPLIPTGPDFDLLNAILDPMLVEGFDITLAVSDTIDPQSITFVAMQRVMSNFGFTTAVEAQANMGTVMRMVLLYHEAFLLGARAARIKEDAS